MPHKNKKPPTTETAQRVPPGFQPGHPRHAGRKKRTAQAARDLADSLGCDPLAFMMQIISCSTFDQVVIAPDGTEKLEKVAVDLATRLDACKAVTNYLYPRLNAQTITGANDGPLEVVGFDITKLLQDPALVEAAQNLSLLMSEGVRPDPDAITDEPRAALPAPARDPMGDLERSANGHWKR